MHTPARTRTKRQATISLVVLVALFVSALTLPTAEAQEASQPARGSRGQQPVKTDDGHGHGSGDWGPSHGVANGRYLNGIAAISRLDGRLPDVARAHGMKPGELMHLLREDPTLFVDTDRELVYFDALAPDESELFEAGSPFEAQLFESADGFAESFPFSEPPVAGSEFALESLPGAAQTIFLDFDGHFTSGTSWNTQNELPPFTSPAYDSDGDPATFSPTELWLIRNAWASVAEDFAPWNVNVTTIDPGPEALSRTSSGDVQWGIRVVISDYDFLGCQCGGVAYVGAFDDRVDEPAFVFNSGFRGIAEAISHEVGHSMLLAHDGIGAQGYYRGHDNSLDAPGWAPIMGSSYWEAVSHWSQQEYTGANNTGAAANFDNGADDIAIISSLTNGNGFGYKLDDHGIGADATALIDGTTTVGGLIETRADRDDFIFETSGGVVSFVATPAAVAANLDIELTLRDESGATVAIVNETNRLDAALTATVPAGRYVLAVNGVGVGAPTGTPITGYSDYGSIGRYTIAPSIEAFGSEVLLMGDANCDGSVNVFDALAIAQYSSLLRTGATSCPLADPGQEINLTLSDANNDSLVNVLDALAVSQCTTGIANVLCPG